MAIKKLRYRKSGDVTFRGFFNENGVKSWKMISGKRLTQHFACWHDAGEWVLTHLPSGLKLPFNFLSVDECREFSVWLEASKRIDWGQEFGIEDEYFKPKLVKRIKDVALVFKSGRIPVDGSYLIKRWPL